MTRLYRRSRAFRILCYILLVPVWQLVEFISDDTLQSYISKIGNAILLALMLVFVAWTWWYSEQRDRRQAAHPAHDAGERPGGAHDG